MKQLKGIRQFLHFSDHRTVIYVWVHVRVAPSTKVLCYYCVYPNLRSTRLEAMGARENGGSAHYFQPPATQAM